jgi:hypothetical protein
MDLCFVDLSISAKMSLAHLWLIPNKIRQKIFDQVSKLS